jgi:NhaP-type Na+/H+ or K+/H+ antiporter
MSQPPSTQPSNGHHEGRSLLQLVIVVALIVVLIFLHQWAGTAMVGDLDPTAMLALGFVVLGSYTIGQLAEVVRLPHITGYLLAGLFFGPSIAHSLAPYVASWVGVEAPWAPFDRGVLNESVIQQLSLFDTLAIALIAISAGGELKLAAVREGMRVMLSIIAGQYTLVMVSVTTFVVLISGSIPSIALPGLDVGSPLAALGLGIVVAAIAFAASPAATLAIISETGAKGPMSRTVLNTIVFEDVLVIVTFVVGKFLAATLLGAEVEPIGTYLAQHVGGGVGLGLALGLGVVLYLRFVGKELMIFLVGVVYTATLVADQLHADKLLMFLTLGFIVGNFSKAGEHLIEKVEQLALPTYVVFFTIAGARMHIDQLQATLPFALALCTLRFFSIYIGVKSGARLGGAAPNTVKYGWLGFIAQAGVALALANQLMGLHGSSGAALGTMVMGGIAVNELFGPVLFKLAVSLAGEGKATVVAGDADLPHLSVPPPPTTTSSRPHAASGEDDGRVDDALSTWPEQERKNPWGKSLSSGSAALDQRVKDLELDLHAIVRDVSSGPLREWRADAEAYLRALRREFLRHHRRLVVRARNLKDQRPSDAAPALRSEQAELAERWRGIVLGRGSRITQVAWKPEDIVEALDTIVANLPQVITVPYDPQSFSGRNDETLLQSVQRAALNTKRRGLRLLGQPEPTRELALRELGRFHLSGTAPDKLQALIALFVQGDRHLANRTRSIFDAIVRGYDALAAQLDSDAARPPVEPPPGAESDNDAPRGVVDIEARLKVLRADVEEELAIGLEEVRRIAQDGTLRTATALAAGLKSLKRDTAVYGTYHLPSRKRRSSRVFARRLRAIELLSADIVAHRRASAATYGMLAMELELVGLEARVKDVMVDHSQRLEGELQRRVYQKVERVQQALGEALRGFHEALATEQGGEALAAKVRLLTEDAERTGAEASRVVLQLHDELRDESKVAPLLDALTVSASALTSRYDVLEGHVGTGEWKLPAALEPVEVAFRDIVQARIDAHIGPELRATTHEIARHVQPLLTALQDLERKLAFNTELATSELDVVADEKVSREVRELLAEMIGVPLERHKAIMDDFVSRSATWPALFGARLREAVQQELRELRSLLAAGDFSRARLREFKRETESRKLRHRAEQLPGALARLRRQLMGSLRLLAGEERYERWRDTLGVKGVVRPHVLDPKAFAAPAPRADLPVIYKRLFSADTMEAGDVLLGREREIHHAQEILARRVKGRMRSVVLVGIDGVGKAAVSNAIVRTGRFKQVRRVTLTAPSDASIFEEVVRVGSEGQLVVVDGVHWLLSMEPGGFEALRRFADIVIADGGRHAWLLHADEVFFRYASNVAPLADAFPDRIRLEPLSAEALRGAVMDRASHSGLGTAFESVDGDSRVEAWLARSASRLRGPMDHYFQELHAASGGLVRDALRLWLASIRGVQNDELVRVGRVPPSPYAALSRLPDEVLVTLYQIMRQGWMHPRVQAHLFRIDQGTAHAELARLAHLGLLEEMDGQVYRVEVHLRGALARVLIEKGWVR